jgi:hypothetical protein
MKAMATKILLVTTMVAMALWASVSFVGCSDGCPGLRIIQRGETDECAPAGVRVLFSVTDCEGTPVAGLEADNFEVINNETNKPFQSEGGSSSFMQALNFDFYTILVLDLSYSIVNNDRLDDVIDGAKSFVKAVVEDPTDDSYKHNVAIYVFGSTSASELLVTFTQDTSVLYSALEGLRDDEGRGSTNLYGAYITAIEELNRVDNTDENRLTARSLVILTDGTHETGDESKMRREALNLAKKSEINAYAIGIKGDYAEEKLRELASRDDSFFLVEQASDLVGAFGDLANRVEEWSKSHYIMGVCSPLEGGKRSLTINITKDELVGSLKVKYEADGFSLIGCDSSEVAEGINCGQSGL